MKNIKELFNNVKTKVKESKISNVAKTVVSKIKDNKVVNFTKSKISSLKNMIKNFTGNHQNVVDSMAGNVSNRFSEKIKKVFKTIVKSLQTKSNNGSKFAIIIAALIKVLSVIATVAFAALVIYCIKDVFLYCLMLVATCAAAALCIEFILSVLSIATGCRI